MDSTGPAGPTLPTFIRVEELTIDQNSPLGSKPNGIVFRGTLNNQVVAVKLLASELSTDLIVSRVAHWQSLSHPHLWTIFGASPPEADPPFIVTPFYAHGNVHQYLMQYPNVDRPTLICETALGMQFLHKRGLAHGRLRPSNILICDDGHACVADYAMMELQSTQSADAHRYLSPEALQGTVSLPSDVYSWAMSAYEIFTSMPPWGVLSEKHIYQLVVYEDSRPDHPETELSIRVGLTDQFWSIIEESWHKESRLRPSFDIIIRLWQAAAADDSQDTTYDLQRAGSSTSILYTHNSTHAHSISTTSVSTGPPAYESEAGEHPSPAESTSTAVATPRALPEARHTLNPTQISRLADRRGTYIPAPPQSAPIMSGSGIPGTFPDFPMPPGTQSPRRGVSVPATPFSPLFRPPGALPVVSEHDSERTSSPAPLHRPSTSSGSSSFSATKRHPIMRTFSPPPVAPPPVSPSVSSSGSSNSNPVNYSMPLTPPGGLTPTLVHVASNQSLSQSPLQRRLTNRTYARSTLDGGEEAPAPSIYEDLSMALPPIAPRQDPWIKHESILKWEAHQRRFTAQHGVQQPDVMSIRTDSNSGGEQSIREKPSPVLLVGALQAEVKEGRSRNIIDDFLAKIQMLAAQSPKDAQRLVTAGAIPTLIHLLKLRAADQEGLEILLMTLGSLAHDPLSANTIYRTNTSATLIEILNSTSSPQVMTLVTWCLNRIARNPEIASGLIKQNLVKILLRGLRGEHATPSISAYCLGTLAQNDSLADTLAELNVITPLGEFLRQSSESSEPRVDNICSALYATARISRSIKLAKAISKTGCVPLLAHHLSQSEDPAILNWSARAVGCLMRPSSSDMATVLLDAGMAAGLARLPSVLPSEEVEPLSAFAFAIQRFSSAEWGSSVRKRLVEAGVVDSLLAALRTAVDEPYPQVHIDLALAISSLSDVGGAALRKEIVNAGGIDILRRVAEAGSSEVAKACNMAIKSTTGNIWSRNAASAKTAMAHNWNGGCPEFQPGCPLVLVDESGYDNSYGY